MDWINSQNELPIDSKDFYVKVKLNQTEEDMCSGKDIHALHNRGCKTLWKPFINSLDLYKRANKKLYKEVNSG